ncbi:hypothetical protein HanXRQr2_Chr05g0236961 [Helianthus annuus]|uniref:Uncharacterized protein n=1 Tax=Helianthus annuus TaxID=4232 RepID=A0A251UTZ8_HELAN|nr:hypothetical protein HanXRQr2_Chr05g0236961 [Helianthus annuus]KAJ0571829.1 hypothetical protein HanHA300_Chr05g0194411 [Helianthus annuus]KAJ0924474.1 hypothetical protein HanPSC8_Chr05g0228561 [Helianthus annuus]
MKRREMKKGPPSTDLLVCFPTRSHLTMRPKMICSPSGVTNSHHHRGKSGGGGGDGGLWSKRNPMGSELSEPTSPKVTCVGQIKARPKSRSCKNWQTVMEEIERMHNNKKHRKKPAWGDAIGFKKESMQFLTSLRSFKFDLGCFGAFPNVNVTSDDDDNDNDNDNDTDTTSVKKGFGGYNDHDHDHKDGHGHGYGDDHDDCEERSSRSAFSKWLMVMEENQDCLLGKEESENPKDDDEEAQAPCVPPSNALLLMRCRSAPTKSLVEEEEEDEEEADNNDEHDDDDDQHDVEKKKENLIELMKYEGDFYKLSCDIAKETWVVGGINKDSPSKTQTSKRCSIDCLQEVKACLQ